MPSLAVTSTTTRTNVSSLSPNSASSLAFSSSGNLRVLQQQQHLASQPASPAARLEAKPEVASNAGGGARSRSGSLTLPPPIPTPGSTAAFSGFFSGPWTPTVNPQNSSESVRSDESASATDDHLVRTLDYLGLHDTNGANSPPQRDLAAGNRNRANTLAAPPIRRRPSAHLLNNPLDSLPEAQSPQSDQLSITAEQTLAGQQQPLFPLLAPNRPRANTGLPSEPASSSRKRAGTTSLLQSSAAVNMLPNSNLGADDEGSSEGSGYYQANLSSTSSIPLAGSGTNSPSNKSLWVGNLPTQTSLADLYATFGVYGPVESVRFLPERVSCVTLLVKVKGSSSRFKSRMLLSIIQPRK